ncbi:Endonuclease/Exonuclease/phosphatase family protein [Histomonas meleagridis]|nr:Endonuclease/Exonuclease/phosphatase family protein [Histomonas meleagridis]
MFMTHLPSIVLHLTLIEFYLKPVPNDLMHWICNSFSHCETDIVQHFVPNILHNSSDSFSADSDPPTFPDDPLIEVYQRNSTRFSDHRPVQCLMRIWVPDEDPAKLEKFKNMRLRKLDEMSILANRRLLLTKY